MGRIITKEIAEERMLAMKRDFKIIEWNGTVNNCIIACNTCSAEIEFKKGSNIYAKNSKYFSFTHCAKCINIDVMPFLIEEYKLKLEMLHYVESNLHKVKKVIEDILVNSEIVTRLEMAKRINVILGYKEDRLKPDYIEGIILDRLCEYEKFRGKNDRLHYRIKNIYQNVISSEVEILKRNSAKEKIERYRATIDKVEKNKLMKMGGISNG